MSNVLTSIRDLVAPGKKTAKVGVVVSVGAGNMLTVETSSGIQYIVAGAATKNDTVLFDEGQIVYRMKRETLRTYYIT